MRTPKDRIRHAISFEVLGILTATPLFALVFDFPLHHMGMVTLIGATCATVWNYVYNLVFDHAMARWAGTTLKKIRHRIIHAILFEAGLLALLVPLVALYLGISLLDALILDLALAGFYLVYAFVFNIGYDRLFPLPEWQNATEKRAGA